MGGGSTIQKKTKPPITVQALITHSLAGVQLATKEMPHLF